MSATNNCNTEIKYNKEDRDFSCYVDGEYVGSRGNRLEAEALCDEVSTAHYDEVAASIWIRLPYHSIADMPAHSQLIEKLGAHIVQLMEHDPVVAELLDNAKAELFEQTTVSYR